MRPKLAVCIPVHHGRAKPMTELLARLVPQVPEDGSVEICVSDNASRDGTERLVAGYQEQLGDGLGYRRHEGDRGLVDNILSVVEMANAEYCWLLGSDDAPAEGAISAILDLLERNGAITGASLGILRTSADDLDQPGSDLEMLPEAVGETRFRTVEEFVRACGVLTLPLSCNLVNRDRWQAVVDDEEAELRDFPIVPQVYIAGRMVQRDPDWVWAERRCVLMREAPTFLDEGDMGADVGRQIRATTADLDRVWARLYGRGSQLHAALLSRFAQFIWHPAVIAALRTARPRGVREYFAQLSVARHFWRDSEFRRRSLPLLLTPRRLTRVDAPAEVRPAGLRARLEGTSPAGLIAARGTRVGIEVANAGTRRLSYAHPNHLALFVRWIDLTSGEDFPSRIGHTPLLPAIARGGSKRFQVSITVPAIPGSYRLEIDLLSANSGWSATHNQPFAPLLEIQPVR